MPKHLSDTRQNAHAKATEAILESYSTITTALRVQMKKVITGFVLTIFCKSEKTGTWVYVAFLDPSARSFSPSQQSRSEIKIIIKYLCQNVQFTCEFFSKIREDFDQQAKDTLSNINYRAVTRIQRKMKEHGNSGNALDTLGKLSSKDRFRVKSFIPMLDAFEANLRRAIVYSDIAEMLLFLADLKATELEIVRGVKLLMEAYPEDVDLKLTDKLLHFYSYVRQSQKLTEEHSFFCVSCKPLSNYVQGKIHTAFPNLVAIFRLFRSLMLRREIFFKAQKNQI